jgi:hypothetical protein
MLETKRNEVNLTNLDFHKLLTSYDIQDNCYH